MPTYQHNQEVAEGLLVTCVMMFWWQFGHTHCVDMRPKEPPPPEVVMTTAVGDAPGSAEGGGEWQG